MSAARDLEAAILALPIPDIGGNWQQGYKAGKKAAAAMVAAHQPAEAVSVPADWTEAEKAELYAVLAEYPPESTAAPLPQQVAGSIRDHADFREDVVRLSEPGLSRKQAGVIRKTIYDTIDTRVENARLARTAAPSGKQLAAQLGDYENKWTVAEQNNFAAFLRRFPNESSQGIISLGDAWKAGRKFEAAAPSEGRAIPFDLSKLVRYDTVAVRNVWGDDRGVEFVSADDGRFVEFDDIAALARTAAPAPEAASEQQTIADLPYQVLFNAIAAAVDSGGGDIDISVTSFRKAIATPATNEGERDE